MRNTVNEDAWMHIYNMINWTSHIIIRIERGKRKACLYVCVHNITFLCLTMLHLYKDSHNNFVCEHACSTVCLTGVNADQSLLGLQRCRDSCEAEIVSMATPPSSIPPPVES